MPRERNSRMRHHNVAQSLSSSSIPSLSRSSKYNVYSCQYPNVSRDEFTELECYLTKEYEDLKSLWLELSEQHAKAKSEEEVLIQMLREIRRTATKENSLDDHTDSLKYIYEAENKASSSEESSPVSLPVDYNESDKQKPLKKSGNDINDSFDLFSLSSPNISEIEESDYTTLELPNRTVLQDSPLIEKSSGLNTEEHLNNALRKLQRLDEEDCDISQDEMTDIISIEKESEEDSRILLLQESDDDHEINDDIEDDGWSEDTTRLALKDMLDMMRD